MSTSPYPGLRPFHRDEADIFFGRDEQVDQLLVRLGKSRFLAVVGQSGCGKSSLVHTGLLNALEAGFLADVGLHWRIATMQPGSHPMRNLAAALVDHIGPDTDVLNTDTDCSFCPPGDYAVDLSSAKSSPTGEGAKVLKSTANEIPQHDDTAFLLATLRRGPLGLIEALREQPLPENTNLLLVVDQFEEIFRYREHQDRDEADAYVALLLHSVQDSAFPVYIVITMRSDFLGDCALFPGLPEALNDSQFLTPRLNREQRRLAITGPAKVCGGDVEPALVNRLLNDMGADPDQLPVLQHALMRLWIEAAKGETKPVLLKLNDYEKLGGWNDTLSNHANEAFAELDEQQKKIAEVMFRALTERSGAKRDTRRPVALQTVASIADVDTEQVIPVIEVFRRPDRSFLMPPEGQPLAAETLIDISHESLIRQWRTLARWVKEEAKSEEIYRRIRDWALRWELGEADLWRGTDLSIAHAWWKHEQPSPDWAERYGSRDEFILAKKFLDASGEAQQKAIVAEKEQRESKLRRARRMAWGFGLLAMILIVGILIYYVAQIREFDTYYNSIVKVRGVPEGIGALTDDQVSHRALSYKITRRGSLGPVFRMETVNSTGQSTIGSGGFSVFENSTTEVVQNQIQESRWEYVYGTNGKVAYEVSLNLLNKRVRSVIYAPSGSEIGNTRSAYLLGQNGSLAPKQGSCQGYVTYDYNDKGYETLTHFRDQMGNPTPGRDNVISLRQEFDSKGNLVALLSLWRDGSLMNDNVGWAKSRVTYDELGNILYDEAFDAGGAPIGRKEEKYFRLAYHYDEYGRVIELSYFDEFKNPVNHAKDGWHRSDYRYDERGNIVEQTFWLPDGSPGKDSNGCHQLKVKFDGFGNGVESACLGADGRAKLIDPGFSVWRNAYDNYNRPIEWTYFDVTGNPVNGPDGAFRVRVRYDEDGNVFETAYYAPDGNPMSVDGYHKTISQFVASREIRTEYLDVSGKLTLRKKGYAAIERDYDNQGNEIKFAYLGTDNQPIVPPDNGYAILLSRFDSCGRTIEQRSLDEKQHAVQPAADGYAIIRKAYDLDNHVSEETYFDVHERPVRLNSGYARLTQLWDKHGNLVDQRYFDKNLEPVRLEDGYAEVKYRYDDHNGILQESYFNEKREPILNKQGFARIEYTNDDYGRYIKRACFGASGEPVNCKDDNGIN